MLFDTVAETCWKTIYTIAIRMGLGQSEILGFCGQDIDFDKSTISINHVLYECMAGCLQALQKTEAHGKQY